MKIKRLPLCILTLGIQGNIGYLKQSYTLRRQTNMSMRPQERIDHSRAVSE